jgi:hypothetical protein
MAMMTVWKSKQRSILMAPTFDCLNLIRVLRTKLSKSEVYFVPIQTEICPDS